MVGGVHLLAGPMSIDAVQWTGTLGDLKSEATDTTLNPPN